MRVNELHYRTNKNLGNYETEHVELVIELDPDEQPGEALVRARAFCRKALALAPLTPEEEARMKALLFVPEGGA
jgi:predicted metalloenzyme YecM